MFSAIRDALRDVEKDIDGAVSPSKATKSNMAKPTHDDEPAHAPPPAIGVTQGHSNAHADVAAKSAHDDGNRDKGDKKDNDDDDDDDGFHPIRPHAATPPRRRTPQAVVPQSAPVSPASSSLRRSGGPGADSTKEELHAHIRRQTLMLQKLKVKYDEATARCASLEHATPPPSAASSSSSHPSATPTTTTTADATVPDAELTRVNDLNAKMKRALLTLKQTLANTKSDLQEKSAELESERRLRQETVERLEAAAAEQVEDAHRIKHLEESLAQSQALAASTTLAAATAATAAEEKIAALQDEIKALQRRSPVEEKEAEGDGAIEHDGAALIALQEALTTAEAQTTRAKEGLLASVGDVAALEARLEEERQTSDSRIAELEARLEEQQTSESRIAELEARLEEERQTSDSRIAELEARLEEEQQTSESRIAELEARLEEERQTSDSRIAELEARLEEEQQTSESRIAELEAQLSDRRTVDETPLTTSVAPTEEEIGLLRTRVRELEETSEAHERAMHETQAVSSAIEERAATAERLVGTLEGSVEEKMRECGALEARVETLVAELEVSARRIGELEREKEGQASSVQSAQSMLQLELEDASRSVEALAAQLAAKTSACDAAEGEARVLREKLAGETAAHVETTDKGAKMRGLLVRLKREVDDLKGKMAVMETSATEAREQYERVREEYDVLRVTTAESTAQLQVQLESAELGARSARKRATEVQEELDGVREEYRSYQVRAQAVLKRQRDAETISVVEEAAVETEGEATRVVVVESGSAPSTPLSSTSRTSLEALVAATGRVRELENEVAVTRGELERTCERLVALEEEVEERVSRAERERDEAVRAREALVVTSESAAGKYRTRMHEMEGELSARATELAAMGARVTAAEAKAVERETRSGELVRKMRSEAVDLQQQLERLRDQERLRQQQSVEKKKGGVESESSAEEHDTSGREPETQESTRLSGAVLNPSVFLSRLLTKGVRNGTGRDSAQSSTRLDDEGTAALAEAEREEIARLREMVHEYEQDVGRALMQEKVLKEEIRRLERNAKREEESVNLEYLKNVVLKFALDAKGRPAVVPVLAELLKFSPEERSEVISTVCDATSASSSKGSAVSSWSKLATSYAHKWM